MSRPWLSAPSGSPSDLPMAQGTIIVLSAGFIVVNLLVDVLYAALDPRIRTA